MEPFLLTEEKALLFHRALLSVAKSHQNLLTRARAEVEKLRADKPRQADIWDRWAALLDQDIETMSGPVLDDTPAGGLLRAHSPFAGALSAAERNAIWQRIGLVQFVGHFMDAAADLALETAEQAALTGVAESDLVAWAAVAPMELQKGELDKLKMVVALCSALKGLAPAQDVRRRWLRADSETLGGTPLALLLAGDMERVMDHLTGAVQLTLGPERYPRM